MTTAVHTEHPDHTHVHGHSCGHESFPHADHTDYVHDGHLHRVHGEHADECEVATHAAAEHDAAAHQHGTECGHVAVPHGDHADFVHDGHRHAVHEGHYDEH